MQRDRVRVIDMRPVTVTVEDNECTVTVEPTDSELDFVGGLVNETVGTFVGDFDTVVDTSAVVAKSAKVLMGDAF